VKVITVITKMNRSTSSLA